MTKVSSAWQAPAALGVGLIFGVGLTLSGMLDPARILGFLNMFGHWDPTLLIVMGAAVAVSAAGYAIKSRWRTPLLDTRFHVPANRRIDWRLVIGASLFGVGWGLVGLCPAPALLDAILGYVQAGWFVGAMLAGLWLGQWLKNRGEAQ